MMEHNSSLIFGLLKANGNTVNPTPANDETQCLHWLDFDVENCNGNLFEESNDETQCLHWLDLDVEQCNGDLFEELLQYATVQSKLQYNEETLCAFVDAIVPRPRSLSQRPRRPGMSRRPRLQLPHLPPSSSIRNPQQREDTAPRSPT